MVASDPNPQARASIAVRRTYAFDNLYPPLDLLMFVRRYGQ